MAYVLIFEDPAGERDRRELDADDDLTSAVVDFVLAIGPLSGGDTIRIEEISDV
jgi:hypothetical protein